MLWPRYRFDLNYPARLRGPRSSRKLWRSGSCWLLPTQNRLWKLFRFFALMHMGQLNSESAEQNKSWNTWIKLIHDIPRSSFTYNPEESFANGFVIPSDNKFRTYLPQLVMIIILTNLKILNISLLSIISSYIKLSCLIKSARTWTMLML